MTITRASLLTCLLALTACATPVPPPPMQTAATERFDRASAASHLARGTAMVRGAVMLKIGRESASCGGATVHLIPATPYTDERMRLTYGPDTGQTLIRLDAPGALAIEPAPAAWLETTLQARCDPLGNFHFDQVGPGAFWVQTTLRWSMNDAPQTGSIAQRITVAPGQTVNLLLSP